MLITHLSVSSFIALANVRHHQLTMERLTAASRLIHIHSQIKLTLYCCFQLLALCSPSASADFQALLFWNSCLLDLGSSRTCWNRFTFRPTFRKRALWVTEMISWLKDGWKMLFFCFGRPPTRPTERLRFSLPDSARWEIPIVSEKVEEVD